MKANELRIGNWVYDDEYYKIEGWELGADNADEAFDPIPLTPEILEKCGFVKESDKWFISSSNIHLTVFNLREAFSVYINDKLIVYAVDCLHQLQNLYFALTGEELQINL